jgi:nucleoside-diphosphate-sugar epimerase
MSKKFVLREIVPRVFADIVSVNVALVLAFLIRFVLVFGLIRATRDGSAIDELTACFDASVKMWRVFCWLLTIASVSVFWFSGFYTFGRAYRSRYKALVILQAVTLAYLVFGALAYLIPTVPIPPRTVFMGGWFFTLAFAGGSRLINIATPILYSLFPDDQEAYARKIEKVLVVGGAGYIGSALVQRLLELGHKVRVLDLLIYGDDPISAFYDHPDFELIQGDFRHIHTVVNAAKGMDAIIHLGAIVGDSACSLDQDLTIEINLRATRTIAEVGKGFGVKRFVFASTCSVYGASDEILDERSALRPISLYARTKMESEKMLLSLTDSTFAPTILRFGTVYGLSGRPRFDLVVNLLTAKAVQDGEAGIFGGQQWRPLVHVRDVAEAIVLTLQAQPHSVSGQVFNVGSNEQNYQITDLGLIIREMVPTARVVTHPKEDNRNYRVRFDKIRNVLSFEPRYTIRDGVQEIIDAFATGKITDYRDPRYSNFSALKRNGELRSIFVEDVMRWAWVNLSATDAMLLAEVVMAVVESQSRELMNRLREGLVQALQGDIDGFLNTLTRMQPTPPTWAQAASAPDRQPVFVEHRLGGSPAATRRVPA